MNREELEALPTVVLDELVRDAKTREAADICARGRELQIVYLLQVDKKNSPPPQRGRLSWAP